MTTVRIDKWLWSVRVYKTRSIASEACKKGNVSISDVAAKPSRVIKVGDIIQVRKNPVVFSFRVLAIPKSRIGAKLVSDYLENVTTADQLELLELGRIAAKNERARGTGRPTKKERRDIDKFFDPFFLSDFEFLDDDD